MYEIFRFVHVLGSVAVCYYLVLPFLVSHMKRDTAAIQIGHLKNMILTNRIGQWLLILQFITGGYMISEKKYAIWWIVLVIVGFLIVGGLAGMMARPMKRIMKALEQGESPQDQIGKIFTFSTIVAIGLIVLIVVMVFPSFR